MCKLSINVDHVATLRQARKAIYPDPVEAAMLCELAGADGITVHLRSDRRHIQDRDLRLLREAVKTSLNLEMAATDEMISIAKEVKPDTVTLVPERPQEITTEGGIDVEANFDTISKAIAELKESRMKVSLFINPDEKSMEASAKLGADYIEINTDSYCEAKDESTRTKELFSLKKSKRLLLTIFSAAASQWAKSSGLFLFTAWIESSGAEKAKVSQMQVLKFSIIFSL